MIREYDVVITIKNINDKVLKGMRGAVLIVYDDKPPKYEIEFLDEEGYTIDVLTLSENDIIKMDWTESGGGSATQHKTKIQQITEMGNNQWQKWTSNN